MKGARPLEDFSVIALEPEETSYEMLKRQIRNLRSKGVDASESMVDLHLKIATPFAAVVMILLAVPLATRGTRATSHHIDPLPAQKSRRHCRRSW